MSLVPGTRLGVYEVVARIGAGGMGEVYRAVDTTLGRDVAVKILPDAFSGDPDRLRRFAREARALAAVNHPHIGAIYGMEDAAGGPALVLELVEGETLAERLQRGPVPVPEALRVARQIADALGAAHDKGIIHRDLKPANVKITPEGVVKVLDFGLAKAVSCGADGPDRSGSPTVTSAGTHAGTVLGTAPYMSPEQAKGRPVDRRADLWAFGAVLYELLTGTRAFQGESVSETVAQILTQTPDWDRLPADTPAPIRTLLRRCLEKDATSRLDSAIAVRMDIDDGLASRSFAAPAAASGARRHRVALACVAALAVVSLVAALGTWAVMRRESHPHALPSRFAIAPPPSQPFEFSGRGREIAISPDGRYLVYHSRSRLMVRALDRLDAEPLAGVTGRTPFFSPDSRWIGFFDGGDLKKAAVTGEPVTTLARGLGSPQAGTWGDDGTIVVASEDDNIGLMSVPADGGEPRALTTTDATQAGHRAPLMLPGGRGVLFTIWAKSAEESQLAVLDLKSGEQRTLLRGGLAAEYLDSGHLVYVTVGYQRPGHPMSGTLWAVAFDLDRLALRGEPVRVGETSQIDMFHTANYTVSRTGTLAYLPARVEARTLVWVDRNGRETPITGLPPRAYQTLGLSPDGTRVAFMIDDREADIWTWDFARATLTRLTFGPSFEYLPRWTPDGLRIVFQSDRAGVSNLYSVASDGSASVERLTTSSSAQFANSVTPDGMAVLGCELRTRTGFDILRFPITAAAQSADRTSAPDGGQSETTSLVSSPAAEYSAVISPDGRYFAYQSAESGGRFEIYVQAYPDVSQGRWQISTEGGVAPVWARDGRELFFIDGTNTLQAVPVDTSGTRFSAGRSAKVFDTKYFGDFYSYDVTPDGRRFLVMKESAAPVSIVVVLNGFEWLQ